MGRLQLGERRPRVCRRDATSVVPVPGVGGGDAFSSGHANVGERRVTDPVQADAERTDPTKSLTHAGEDGVKAPVRETRAIRVAEHSFGTMAATPGVRLERLEQRLGDRDLALLLELLVEDDGRRWVQIGQPEIEDALAPTRCLATTA